MATNVNSTKMNTLENKLNALRDNGVDVSNYFSMNSFSGGTSIVKIADGGIQVVTDDDPIFKLLSEQGDIYNPHLVPRWVMGQMFSRFLRDGQDVAFTAKIRQLGLSYSWKVTLNKLYALTRMMLHGDAQAVDETSLYYNLSLLLNMSEDLREKLEIGTGHKHFRGMDYRCGKLSEELAVATHDLKVMIAKRNNSDTGCVVSDYEDYIKMWTKFNAWYKKHRRTLCTAKESAVSKAFIDAFKGYGAYNTCKNMLMYHDCKVKRESGEFMSKSDSLSYLWNVAAENHCDGTDWCMIGFMKQLISDNSIDVKEKIRSWRK